MEDANWEIWVHFLGLLKDTFNSYVLDLSLYIAELQDDW
jgi:hypothetical protein